MGGIEQGAEAAQKNPASGPMADAFDAKDKVDVKEAWDAESLKKETEGYAVTKNKEISSQLEKEIRKENKGKLPPTRIATTYETTEADDPKDSKKTIKTTVDYKLIVMNDGTPKLYKKETKETVEKAEEQLSQEEEEFASDVERQAEEALKNLEPIDPKDVPKFVKKPAKGGFEAGWANGSKDAFVLARTDQGKYLAWKGQRR